MTTRRGRGEGSISKRPDGRWVARVHLGWSDGRRRRKSFYGSTRREVAGKLAKALRDVDQGIFQPDERTTVGEFLTRWLEHKRPQIRPRAWATYEQAVRLHLSGLAKVRLARLSPQLVDAWFSEHGSTGASNRTIRYARVVLRVALNQAKRWRLVHFNAAALSDVPRHRPREIAPLAPHEARALLAAVKEHRLCALVSVGLALGLRLGEALGLQWADVDLDAATLRIERGLERSGGDAKIRRDILSERRRLKKQLTLVMPGSEEHATTLEGLRVTTVKWRAQRTTLRLVEPKSARSRRTVRMPQVVVKALKEHRRRQLEEKLAAGKDWQDGGIVFATPIGTPTDPRNVTREFHGMLRAAQLPRVRFHDLRHTAATLLLAQGVDPRTIMETLGHSQISLTLNTYAHVLPALQIEAANRIDAVLNG